MPVKPLSFKGDKKISKKRKHHESVSSDAGPYKGTQNQAQAADEDDSWTSPTDITELTGPTIIVLPTSPPTCLASDANGRIFASPLENMIDNDPRTAEPHDVRQVWVATKVPGTSTGSEAGEVGFKGAHGGWLSCDSVGVLGAIREARGTEEGFIIEKATQEDDPRRSGWLLRTAASKKSEGEKGKRYVCAVTDTSSVKSTAAASTTTATKHDESGTYDENEDRRPRKLAVALRGDGEVDEDSSRLLLRMQARFLPQSANATALLKSKEKVSRSELEKAVGRKLEDDEVRRLKRAKRHGNYYEEVLDMRAKSSHDKFA